MHIGISWIFRVLVWSSARAVVRIRYGAVITFSVRVWARALVRVRVKVMAKVRVCWEP